MLLALDIGNTNIAMGVFDGERLAATWRLATDPNRMPDEYGVLLSQLLPLKGVALGQVSAVAMCSVVPPLTPTFVELCHTYLRCDPLVVGAGTKTGVRVVYDSPRDVGADRIVDAAAGLKLYGGPLVIVDLGTAAVFDAVSRQGEYLGGAIAPGISIAAEAMFYRAAQLRRVELVRPPAAIGKTTVQSMQSGLVLGYAELVKGMVRRIDEELGGGSRIVGTGGLIGLVAKEAQVFHVVDPDLTLTGLRIVHDLNRG